jgi:penicillin-binding protein 1C
LRLPDDGRPPGLPLVLGGVAVSLEELTQLYVALARGGLTAPLIFRPDQPEALATSLLSPAAARQVLQILAGAAPPPGQVQAVEVLGRGAIAIKTGTSYGFRDAWAFGVTSRHTVGVWVGRPDGTPSPDRIGRTTAAPILWRVFDVLDDGGLSVTAAAPGQPPAELLRRIDGGDGENRRIRVADANRLRLVFPQAEMVVDASSGGSGVAPLTLIAEGGRRPLTWMIDGRPLATTPTSRQVDWQPEHLGPVRITVIDADGRVDSAPVILR